MGHSWGFDPRSPGALKLACGEEVELLGFEADHLVREGRAEYVSERFVS